MTTTRTIELTPNESVTKTETWVTRDTSATDPTKTTVSMYDYEWGSEDGEYEVIVVKLGYEEYGITFEQTVLCGSPLMVVPHTGIREWHAHTTRRVDNNGLFDVYRTTVRVRAILNPPPEALFRIVGLKDYLDTGRRRYGDGKYTYDGDDVLRTST